MLTGNAFLPGRRCSVHVMMQRVVADKLLGDAVLDGIGLMARMLIVEPRKHGGYRPFREAPPECAPVLRTYTDTMLALLTRPPVTAPDTQDVLDPPIMTLTPDARAMWVGFHDAVESDLRRGGELHPIRAFGAKMGEHAGRLAAVLIGLRRPRRYGGERRGDGVRDRAGTALRGRDAAASRRRVRLPRSAVGRPVARVVAGSPGSAVPLGRDLPDRPGAAPGRGDARRIVGILEEHGFVRPCPPERFWMGCRAPTAGNWCRDALTFDPWATLKRMREDAPLLK